MEPFDKAIEDTITALNTGTLRSRDGAVLAQAKGKTCVQNLECRVRMDAVGDLLRAIRSRYADARRRGVTHRQDRADGHSYHCIHDPELAHWMDMTRTQAHSILGEVCKEVGVVAPVFPRPVPRWREPR